MKSNIENTASLGLSADFRPSISYVLDPRFPGGTSGAVAHELDTISGKFRPRVFGLSSGMFSGREVAPVLAQTFERQGIVLDWNPQSIQADIVVLHNPAFLKFSTQMNCRLLARKLLVVTHENFIRPSGADAFDVAGCLNQIDAACLAHEKIIAPISPYNRKTVVDWLNNNPGFEHWQVLDNTWFNICDFKISEPNPAPADRRGRLSRPGFEKFPSLADLEHCFSTQAETNTILGADNLMDHAADQPHWHLVPFRGIDVQQFMDEIDFMVYFTSRSWRESFGRVIAEATAAGKLVITDEGTAAIFGPGVISATPEKVDGIIAEFIANPKQYADQVKQAQKSLRSFEPKQFLKFFERQTELSQRVAP